jgi:hypothetical protein
MLWIALLLFAGEIALQRLTPSRGDDVVRILGSLLALVCLVSGLIVAPLLLRSLLLLGLIFYPTCFSQLVLGHHPTCPRLCLFQSQCHPSLRDRFSAHRR